MAHDAYSDPGAVVAGDPLPAAYLNTTRANGAWFSEPPQCSVYSSSSSLQSVPNTTITALLCPLEVLDNYGMHSTSSNTSRITIIEAGRYTFTGTASFGSDADGIRRLTFRVNGTTEYDMLSIHAASANGMILSASRTITLAVSDYVELTVYQSSGGALDSQVLAFEAILVSTTPL